MEPEGSLPCSQQPATGPCHKSDESSPQILTLLSKIHFNNISKSSTSGSYELSIPFLFSDQHFVHISHLSHECCMTYPSQNKKRNTELIKCA
jgi:hypothetical protein